MTIPKQIYKAVLFFSNPTPSDNIVSRFPSLLVIQVGKSGSYIPNRYGSTWLGRLPHRPWFPNAKCEATLWFHLLVWRSETQGTQPAWRWPQVFGWGELPFQWVILKLFLLAQSHSAQTGAPGLLGKWADQLSDPLQAKVSLGWCWY